MPTINPRVNVTLSPSTDALVSRMARLQRVSKSQVLRELLEAAEPALQRAAALMEAAEAAPGSVLANLAHSLERVQAIAETQLAEVLSHVDTAGEDLVAQAEAVRGRRPGRAVARPGRRTRGTAGHLTPPASNRGVKSVGRGKKGGRGGKR
jgi:hypothetical protein